jgi:hypothetical protein
MADKTAIRPDPRLIIEKGGYRPDQGGPTLPPAHRPRLSQDSYRNDSYRPTSGGPTTPPVKPSPTPPASNAGSKK